MSLAKIEDLIEKKIMYAFPLSLSSHAAEWYDSVEVGKTKVWGRLIEEFIKQFFYDTMVDVTLTNLETTKQKISKTFSEFLIRWREKNSKMISRPTEKDQVHVHDHQEPPSVLVQSDSLLSNNEFQAIVQLRNKS